MFLLIQGSGSADSWRGEGGALGFQRPWCSRSRQNEASRSLPGTWKDPGLGVEEVREWKPTTELRVSLLHDYFPLVKASGTPRLLPGRYQK